MNENAVEQQAETPAPEAMTLVSAAATPANWELTEDQPRGQAVYRHAGIVPSKTNPRKRFDPVPLQELADNIAKHGILMAILCRPLPGSTDGTLEIIAGERRWRAAALAGLAEVPIRVVYVDDLDMLELQIIENLQRQDLHELEEAESYEALLLAHKGDAGYGVDEIAAKVGKSRAYVYARLKLCALRPKARTAFYDGELTASTALLLARIPVPDLQDKALKEITKGHDGVMSYRAAADHVQRTYMLRLDQAKFKIADATLLPGAGACTECPKRTGANPDLFSDVGSADVCTDPLCFGNKRVAHGERIRHAAIQAAKLQ
jgi:ParB/RepB/Spo0J family partition protein